MLYLAPDHDVLDAEVFALEFRPDTEDEHGFFQFKSEEMASDFGLDFPDTAEYYECSHVYEDGDWQPVSRHELVFPVFCVLAPGWSWAMWAMRTTVSNTVGKTSSLAPDPLLIEDKHISPPLLPGHAVAGTYVDNFAVLARSKSDARARYHCILDGFKKLGIVLHELVERSPEEPFEQLGLHFCGELRRLRVKPARAWRLALGLRGFQQLPLVYGWQLRVLLGHVVNYFQLCLWVLSVITTSYQFVQAHLEDKAPLWASVKREL